jgi:pimeloyl-ACP methyl ester carboxylesterase
MDIFAQWSSDATTFGWRSSTPANGGREVTVFTRRAGMPGAPALVCVHGFPTSSIDYFALVGELGADFDIFLLDFPGFGCSDKPPAPYVYSLYDDARLLVHAITQIWKLTDYAMITHDRGSSVGMIALSMLAAEHPQAVPTEVIVTNANIYLPLGNLTAFQNRAARPRHRACDRGSDHSGNVGSRAGSEHLHAAAHPGRPRDRRPGEMLCPPRRHPRTARYDSIPARARRR